MKSQMLQTSLEAYRQAKGLRGKRKLVYDIILERGPLCNQDIANILDWEINRITGRVKELREQRLVEIAHKAKGPTGRNVMYWQVRSDW